MIKGGSFSSVNAISGAEWIANRIKEKFLKIRMDLVFSAFY